MDDIANNSTQLFVLGVSAGYIFRPPLSRLLDWLCDKFNSVYKNRKS